MKPFALKARLFEYKTKDPIKAQEKLLLEFINRNKNTAYGLKYHFKDIKSIKDFQRLLPLNDYESLRSFTERMAGGERNVLTSDKVIFFGKTSGTTGTPKFIPVTEYSRSKKAELMALWSYYVSKDHPGAITGKVFAIIDPEVKSFTDSGIPCGPENGHAYVNLPFFVKKICAIPYEAFKIEDYDARYYTLLRLSIEQDVTAISTLNPSAIVILCQKISEWKDKIINDIEKGAIDADFNIEPDIRKVLERGLKPNVKRAEELRGIIRFGQEFLPKNFWPNMEMIQCWKGGAVKLYLKELPRYFGDIPIRDFGCLSTEARNSIPITDEGAGGILAIDTNFYEFIPKEDMAKEEKRVLLCDELEEGKDYLLVVTTPGGLYRYSIDDVVHVDGFFNKTPIIEFVQKGVNAVSLSGEKVYEAHIAESVNAAADKLKLTMKFFTASVQLESPPRYIFLVEFNNTEPDEKKKELLRTVEAELSSRNLEYEDTRNRFELNAPILKVVKRGGFEKYRVKRVSQGAHETQFKIPELIKDPDFQKNFEIEEEIFLDKTDSYAHPSMPTKSGLRMMGKISVFEVKGDYWQMGREYGKIFKGYLNRFYKTAIEEYLIKESRMPYLKLFLLSRFMLRSYPAKFREMFKGMSEASGMSVNCLIMLDQLNAFELIRNQNIGRCSNLAVWGNYSVDSAVVFGRNFDQPESYKRFNEFVAIVTFRPEGGIPFASISYPGQIGISSAINECGIFLANNEAPVLKQDVININTPNMLLSEFEFLASSRTLEDLDKKVNASKANCPAIVSALDENYAYTYEWTSSAIKRRGGIYDSNIAATNHFVDPSWERPVLPEAYGKTGIRYNNLLSQAGRYKGQFNAGKMEEVLETLVDNGGPMHKDKTIYQIVALPRDRRFYIKIPGFQDWTEISLTNLFD